ncbi:hypothetical protein LCGC14_0884010 [marine sediment metagenome]|uniref:Holliday junction resolvase n=1 Tax=marine sediment metagenome TaxID=412755 RepID=A0A0F9S825_9ZZZZ
MIDELDPGFSVRSSRGKKNRSDGKRFEQETARALRRVFPDAKRLFGQSRDGNEVPDLGGTPYWIECGRGSTISIQTKLKQGTRDSANSPSVEYAFAPVVVVVRNPKTKVTSVTMTLEEFIDLLGQAHGV